LSSFKRAQSGARKRQRATDAKQPTKSLDTPTKMFTATIRRSISSISSIRSHSQGIVVVVLLFGLGEGNEAQACVQGKLPTVAEPAQEDVLRRHPLLGQLLNQLHHLCYHATQLQLVIVIDFFFLASLCLVVGVVVKSETDAAAADGPYLIFLLLLCRLPNTLLSLLCPFG
jgi:hypothetical protein